MGVIAQHGFASGNVLGLILAFGVPFTFAIQTLFLRRYREHDMMTTICAGGFLSFIIASLASTFIGPAGVFAVGRDHMLLLFAMGVVQLAVPLIFYGWGARSVPAVTLSLIVMLDAVFNPFWSWAVVGEMPEFTSLVGGAIILGAVTLSIIAAQFFPAKTA
nr:DMT family transporter [Aestuariivirga litoralis]